MQNVRKSCSARLHADERENARRIIVVCLAGLWYPIQFNNNYTI